MALCESKMRIWSSTVELCKYNWLILLYTWKYTVTMGAWVLPFMYHFSSLYWHDKPWYLYIKYFMIFGPRDELINAPQYWMDYFYPTNFLDWLSYESQRLKLKTYGAKQVWIYFNKCIITSSSRPTITDIHRPLWREMGWKEKRFR